MVTKKEEEAYGGIEWLYIQPGINEVATRRVFFVLFLAKVFLTLKFFSSNQCRNCSDLKVSRLYFFLNWQVIGEFFLLSTIKSANTDHMHYAM